MPISPLTLQQILDEADVLVPNSLNVTNKIKYLNEINVSFFEIVKIPRIIFFNVVADTSTVTLSGQQLAMRNIDRVMVGTSIYRSLQLQDVAAGNYGYVFDEPNTLTLDPPPSTSGRGYVRTMQNAITTFTESAPAPNTQFPEAPAAYHELYVLGLAEKISKAQDDVVKANNYGSDYRSKLMIAQQNYAKPGGPA